MKCGRCEAEMYQAKMDAKIVGAQLIEILLVNRKEGFFEPEKRSAVSCYVCPGCGHIELFADDPKGLQID